MSLGEYCFLALVMCEWLIMLSRCHRYLLMLFYAFLNSLDCLFDVAITFGKVWTWGDMFKVPCFEKVLHILAVNSGSLFDMITLGMS